MQPTSTSQHTERPKRPKPVSESNSEHGSQSEPPISADSSEVKPAASNAKKAQPEKRTARIKFADCEGFHRELRARVKSFFANDENNARDVPGMYLKSFVILAWTFASYLLMFWFTAWWQIVLLSGSLGLAMAAVGFNIQHDGGHSAYSERRWINRVMAYTMDLIGASSYVWKHRHNIIHHTYTNITGHDGDVDLGFLGRLTPHQPRLSFHRFQHFYLWPLYGFVTAKWHLMDDFNSVRRGKIGETSFPRPKGKDLVYFLGGKALFFSLAFFIPMIWFPWYIVAGVYFLATFLQGIVMSMVFQLAHVIEHAEFPMPEGDSMRMEAAWAVHQVQTTVNFAMDNRVVCWYTGGLNYQIEHHLFPHVCHLNYPKLSKVVASVCDEYGVEYNTYKTVSGAVAAHYRWLKEMGQPEVVA